MLIDFDVIDDWNSSLQAALSNCVPADFAERLREAGPEYIEDARELLFEVAGREAVIDSTLSWLSANRIAGYHGTRLTSEDISAIRAMGLIPLQADARRKRLVRALSTHPAWGEASARLDEVLHHIGASCAAGKREGQVHLTLSSGGLTAGFNHYLRFGAEFDYHAAHDLLGKDGQELLAKDGEPMLIQVAVPGTVALKAGHPHFSVNDLRERGDVPNIVGDFLAAWAFRFKTPSFNPGTQRIDCGMIFYETIPAEWIVRIDKWDSEVSVRSQAQ